MSQFKITLEITSLNEANALVEALQNYLDCNQERLIDERRDIEDKKAAGKPVDWRETRDTKQLGEHVAAVKSLLKAIES